MPRRLSLATLLGLIATAVLSFGLTAGAAPRGASGDDEIAAAKQRLADIRMKAGSAYEAHDNAVVKLAELDDEIAATAGSRNSSSRASHGSRTPTTIIRSAGLTVSSVA